MSTALQEFFGISVIEGMAAGAFPILPDRLVYPERIPDEFADRMLYRSEEGAVDLLGAALDSVSDTHETGAAMRAHVDEYAWPVVAAAYDGWLESIGPS